MLYAESSTKKAKDYACTKKSLLLTSLIVIWILIRFVPRMDFDEFSHVQLINAYLAVFVIVTNQVNFLLFIIWVFLPCYCFDCFKSKKQISVFYSSSVLMWIHFLVMALCFPVFQISLLCPSSRQSDYPVAPLEPSDQVEHLPLNCGPVI